MSAPATLLYVRESARYCMRCQINTVPLDKLWRTKRHLESNLTARRDVYTAPELQQSYITLFSLILRHKQLLPM
jgi:hypothetical protein